MNRSRITRIVCVLAIMLVGALGIAHPSRAADSPDFIIPFPAGTACDFDLNVEVSGGPQVNKVFTDKNDNVRMISAGTGSALTFMNVENGKTLSLAPNGAVSKIAFNLDGSYTQVMTGHNVLFLFPTDVPAGPSTTLYVGRVVFDSDPFNNYTVKSTSGTSTDICVALSS